MKYLGPADVLYLEEGGKAYRRGDNVPMTKELAQHLGKIEHGGHRFEGVAVEPRPARTESTSSEMASTSDSKSDTRADTKA